jgi:hypothetical protein
LAVHDAKDERLKAVLVNLNETIVIDECAPTIRTPRHYIRYAMYFLKGSILRWTAS